MKIIGFVVIIAVIHAGFAIDSPDSKRILKKICKHMRNKHPDELSLRDKLMIVVCDVMLPLKDQPATLPPGLKGLQDLNFKLGNDIELHLPFPKHLPKSDGEDANKEEKSRPAREHVPGHISKPWGNSHNEEENNKRENSENVPLQDLVHRAESPNESSKNLGSEANNPAVDDHDWTGFFK